MFRPKSQQPEFASLKGTLAQVKAKDKALYQTIRILIERLTQFQGITVDQLGDIDNSINDINSVVNIVADKFRSYLTVDDESLKLPHSRQLLAGLNVTFDDTVPNRRTINVTAGVVSDHIPMALGSPGPIIEWMAIDEGGILSPLIIEYTP